MGQDALEKKKIFELDAGLGNDYIRKTCHTITQNTACLLGTDVLHKEAVILIRVGDVLATELHAVGPPDRGVILVKETLPI